MDCLRARAPRNIENQITTQIRLRCRRRPQAIGLVCLKHMKRGTVRIRINSNGVNAKLTAASYDAERDFATIGNQNFPDRCSSIRHGKKGF